MGTHIKGGAVVKLDHISQLATPRPILEFVFQQRSPSLEKGFLCFERSIAERMRQGFAHARMANIVRNEDLIPINTFHDPASGSNREKSQN